MTRALPAGPAMTHRATVCPICTCAYDATIWQSGTRCGDLSHGQARTCVGRLIPYGDFRAAEWRLPSDPAMDASLVRRGPR